ncbi:hypothetical protein V2J09_009913 [Rumex salicifolius]
MLSFCSVFMYFFLLYNQTYEYLLFFEERKTVMDSINILKKESKTESKRVLKFLIAYLEEMGMPAEKTYEQAIQRLFKGSLNPTVKEQISDEIGKYIAWRLNKAAKIFNTLFFVLEWDSEVLKLIIEVIEDLKKDLLLPVPELEEISSLASDVLKADEKWKDVMANGVKDHMRMWLINTVYVDEIMEKWAKNPTRKIESGFRRGRKFSEFCKARSG